MKIVERQTQRQTINKRTNHWQWDKSYKTEKTKPKMMIEPVKNVYIINKAKPSKANPRQKHPVINHSIPGLSKRNHKNVRLLLK